LRAQVRINSWIPARTPGGTSAYLFLGTPNIDAGLVFKPADMQLHGFLAVLAGQYRYLEDPSPVPLEEALTGSWELAFFLGDGTAMVTATNSSTGRTLQVSQSTAGVPSSGLAYLKLVQALEPEDENPQNLGGSLDATWDQVELQMDGNWVPFSQPASAVEYPSSSYIQMDGNLPGPVTILVSAAPLPSSSGISSSVPIVLALGFFGGAVLGTTVETILRVREHRRSPSYAHAHASGFFPFSWLPLHRRKGAS